MDIAMPGLNGIEAVAHLTREHPRVRVLILSMYQNEDYVRQALRAGAAGYLVKDAAPVELELALKAVMHGETYLSPAVSKSVVDDSLRRGSEAPTPFERLTPRQREILQLVAEGHSTKDIARLLDLSVKTVESHRTALMKTLDLHDVAGLVRYAVHVGLVTPQK
jgi:DNA-binding NarL/FixJ family response regulator